MTEQQSKIQQIIDIVQKPPIADIEQIPGEKTSYRWQPRWTELGWMGHIYNKKNHTFLSFYFTSLSRAFH
jgi:hypothetical protein